MHHPDSDTAFDQALDAFEAAEARMVAQCLRALAATLAARLPQATRLHLDIGEDGIYPRGYLTAAGADPRTDLYELPDEIDEAVRPLVRNLDDHRLTPWAPYCCAYDDRRGTYTLELARCAVADPAPPGPRWHTVIGSWFEPAYDQDAEDDMPGGWVEVVEAADAQHARQQAIDAQKRAHPSAVGLTSADAPGGGGGTEPYAIAVLAGAHRAQ
jgi:hypothetical protein